MRLVIIGSGNVANVLARKFVQAGHQILQIVGRNTDRVDELAESVHAAAVDDFAEITRDADVYIVAVSDDAIGIINTFLPALNGIVAHTAGSVNKDMLQHISKEFGAFYPLQSLKAGPDRNVTIPILIDGNTAQTVAVLQSLAESISDLVQIAGDEDRIRLHLAATVVNNFSNHLFALAYDYCRKENLSFEMLIPLIINTVDKLGSTDPASLQTGPAKRKDIGTIEKHLSMLQDQPKLKKIYATLSESIMRTHPFMP